MKIIEFEFEGIGYKAEIELETETVDNGIGCYEFWGAKGFDSQICEEITDFEIVSIEDWNGNEPTEKMVKILDEQIWNLIENGEVTCDE